MRKAAIVLLAACAVVAALLLVSDRGGFGGRRAPPAPAVAAEPAAMPEAAAPPTPAPAWRAVGDAKGAARGEVEILLAFDDDERTVARGGIEDGAFAVELPMLGSLPLLQHGKLAARVDAPGFLPARSEAVALQGRDAGDVRLDVPMTSGACLRGRAVDDGGRPVEGALVWLSPRELDVSGRSDALGRFVLPLREPSDVWLCARKDDVGVGARGPLRVSPLADVDILDLVLTGPAALSGVVLYPDGTPARRFDLSVFPPSVLRGERFRRGPSFDAAKAPPPTGLAWGAATTDEGGRFTIRGLLPGRYVVPETWSPETFETGADARVVLDSYRILVRVVDETGAPVGLGASARSDAGDMAAGELRDIRVRPGERWTLTIGARDIVPAAATVEVRKEQREYEVTLVARRPLEFARAEITLLDPRGRPIPEIRASLCALPGEDAVLYEEKLGPGGRTPDVPAARYRLAARPSSPFALLFPAEAEVELRAGAVAKVELAARAGGRLKVTFRREGGMSGEELGRRVIEARPLGRGDPVNLTRFVVRSDGGYQMGGSWRLGETAMAWQLLEPGQYDLHVRAKGHRPLVVPVLVLAEEVTPVEVVLEPEGR